MIHFVSDIHLSAQARAIADRFLNYLFGPARGAERLFILGDLFEVWVGDDSLDTPKPLFTRPIVEAFLGLASSGVDVALMRGNRDFLLDREFSAQTGTRLLPDPYILSTPTRRFVLSHGDMLCTDDTEYQARRAESRSREWRETFLARPLAEREAFAEKIRSQSEAAKQAQNLSSYADLAPRAIDDFLRAHDYATFIHGHTHRPAMHEHRVDGVCVERWVLADWTEDWGEYLSWDGERLTRNAV
jgi:UDP-2,3-diacylglucosamine hydrolase